MKRISWSIIAALIATLFLPVNAAQALSAGQLTCVKSQVIFEESVSVATDSQGNIYVADRHLVRKVNPTTGDATIIAGTGERGLSGNGGPAVDAKLDGPRGLAISGTTLYFVQGNRIRKVDLVTGTISAFASEDNLRSVQVIGIFVYAVSDRFIHTFNAGGEEVARPYTSAGGNSQSAVDSNGNLYFTKLDTKQVMKMSTSDQVVTTFAGSGEGGNTGDGGLATAATFDSLGGIAIDSSNNVYISDTSAQIIRKVNASDGKISTFVTGVRAGTMAMVGSGTLLFGEDFEYDYSSLLNNKLKAINLQTKAVSVLTGGSPHLFHEYGRTSGNGGLAKNANLGNSISGFYIDPTSKDIFLSSYFDKTIRRIDGTTGIISMFAGSYDQSLSRDVNVVATQTRLHQPDQVVKGPDGNFYFGDNNFVKKIDKITKIITVIAGGGQENTEGGLAINAQLARPRGVAFDSLGNLYIAEMPGYDLDYNQVNVARIRKINANGQIYTIAGTATPGAAGLGYSGDGGPASEAKLGSPNAMAIDSQDNLYFAESDGNVIRKINLSAATPTITKVAGRGTNAGLAFTGLATAAVLNRPAYDTNMILGPDGNLYWGEGFFGGGNAIRSVDLSSGPNAGKISTVLLNTNGAINFDAQGNLLVIERGSIFKFDKANNTISLVAGAPGTTNIGGSLVTTSFENKPGCNIVPQAAISVGPTPNSQVATIASGVTQALIPSTSELPAITLNFGGTAPTAVTVSPVANPATPAASPFNILASTKIVDITPTGTFNGSATVCLDGASTDSIFHFTGGQWVELGSRSYVNGQACGVTTSFSPFTAAEPTLAPVTAAEPTLAPVIVYVAPTPVPYLKTLTLPQIRKSGNQLLCTPGTYNAGYTLEGVVQGSQTTLYTPVSYTFRLLFDHVAQSSLTVITSSNSATWDLGIAPAGVLVSCAVTVTGNSLINTDASTANAASVSEALTAKTKSLSAAQNEYEAAVSANSKSYQKALVDNRTTWRANVEKDRNFYQAELIRINGLPASKVSTTLKSAALKTYLADRKKTVADYKASGPSALAARDLANKAALDTKNAAISKARSMYGSFIDSIGYGVLIP